jgi:Trypsin-like peptidase domain
MNFIFLIFCILADRSFAASTSSVGPDLFEKTRKEIIILAADGGVCAGTHLGNGLVLTSAHCVPYNFFKEVFAAENLSQPLVARLLARDKEADLALLRVEGLTGPGLKVRSSTKTLRRMESVMTIGHPGLAPRKDFTEQEAKILAFTPTRGEVSNYNDQWTRLDIRVFPGNSGGPVLDSEGEIVGVISNLNSTFAHSTSLEKIEKFLDSTENKTDDVGARESDYKLELNVFGGFHSYMRRLDRNAEMSYYEIDLDIANRFRIGAETNASEGLRYSAYNLGYKFALKSDARQLLFAVVGLKTASYLLNPREKDTDKQDYRKFRGAYVLLNTGHAGFVVSASVGTIEGNIETILGLGLFF